MTSANFCSGLAAMRRQRLVPRRGFADEAARAPDQLAVGVDLAFTTKVADQIEVEGRTVLPAEVGEPHPERDVHRPADLLVEEDVARESVDLVVEAEGDLADRPRALVHLEQRVEVAEPARRVRRDDAAALEAEAQVVDLAPLEH